LALQDVTNWENRLTIGLLKYEYERFHKKLDPFSVINFTQHYFKKTTYLVFDRKGHLKVQVKFLPGEVMRSHYTSFFSKILGVGFT
jgi:hypothetical protein